MILNTPAVLIQERLYDTLGQPAVSTIQVALNANGVQPVFPQVLGFISAFVTFRDPTDATWVAGGPLDSDSLVTQWVDTSFSSADAPYCYTGRYYEKDPTHRLLQSSLPGNTFKVPANSSEADYTLHLEEGYVPSALSVFSTSSADEPSPVFALPQTLAGSQLSLRAQQSFLGLLGQVTQVQVRDFLQRPVAQIGLQSSTNYLLTGYQYQLGAQTTPNAPSLMQVTNKWLPNAYAFSTAAQTVQRSLNALGQELMTQTPDAGETNRFYDVYGRLRFSQNADQAASQIAIYYLYDSLNRLIEKGFIQQLDDWVTGLTQIFLTVNYTPNANDPPDSSWSPQPLRQYVYDQVADVSLSTAQLTTQEQVVSVTSWNTTTDPTSQQVSVVSNSQLTETYTYDTQGRKISIELVDVQANSYITSYTYTAQHTIASMTYPSSQGDTPLQVGYGYNLQGQVKGIGGISDYLTTNPAYGRYQYNPNGQIATEFLGTNNQSLTFTYGNPLYQLTILQDKQQFMTFYYSYEQNSAYQDGNIQTAQFFFAKSDSQAYTYDYTYDAFDRLTAATASQDGANAWNLTNCSFDNNGNLTAVSVGSQNYTNGFDSSHDNNQLKTITLDGTPVGTYQYTTGGLLQTSTMNQMTTTFYYDQLLRLPTQVTVSTNDVDVGFIYNSLGERYQKQVNGGTSITYLRGLGIYPLVELIDGNVWQYVYGPTGLIVIIDNNNNNNLVLKDHLGSIRIIHQETNNQTPEAYFNYLPYGDLMPGNYTAGSEMTYRYLYTGQEWDSELGLYNFHARQYDPCYLKRFLTWDPRHQFASPYLYNGNNPINRIDLTGKISIRIVSYNSRGMSQEKLDGILKQANEVRADIILVQEASTATEKYYNVAKTKNLDYGYQLYGLRKESAGTKHGLDYAVFYRDDPPNRTITINEELLEPTPQVERSPPLSARGRPQRQTQSREVDQAEVLARPLQHIILDVKEGARTASDIHVFNWHAPQHDTFPCRALTFWLADSTLTNIEEKGEVSILMGDLNMKPPQLPRGVPHVGHSLDHALNLSNKNIKMTYLDEVIFQGKSDHRAFGIALEIP